MAETHLLATIVAKFGHSRTQTTPWPMYKVENATARITENVKSVDFTSVWPTWIGSFNGKTGSGHRSWPGTEMWPYSLSGDPLGVPDHAESLGWPKKTHLANPRPRIHTRSNAKIR